MNSINITINKPKLKSVIKDGMSGFYIENKYTKIPVVICGVKKDYAGYSFYALNKNNGLYISKNNKPIRFVDTYALGNTIVIDTKEQSTKEKMGTKTEEEKEYRQLIDFFKNNIECDGCPYIIDKEQAKAVMSNKNTLVTARAGSGKTRVIVAKILYLIEFEKLNENNILTFCFNKDAKEEIRDRLTSRCKINGIKKCESFDVSKTFHSFAKQACGKGMRILENKGPLIKKIITDLKEQDLDFAKQLYYFFKDDTLRIDRKHFKSKESYYRYVRNCEYTTLNQEKVKSRSEKFIADYFFEHDIPYVYEKSFYPYKIDLNYSNFTQEQIKKIREFLEQKKETIPDFYLSDYDVVWEHWAISGNETMSQIEEFENAVCNYKDYMDNMKWKKKFWANGFRENLSPHDTYNEALKSVKHFVETKCTFDLNSSYESLEKQIEQVLDSLHIPHNKLEESILIERVWEKCVDGFTELVEQFINKLQQNYFDNEDIFVEQMNKVFDDKTRTYYQLGYKVYKKYIEILNNRNNEPMYESYNNYSMDFNQLIYQCGLYIRTGMYDYCIQELKWLLIDEYQDFSRLFDYLIDSILQRNKNIKLFCVGDDWQAINRFAGSDLRYFKSFCIRYKDSIQLNISTNYRSQSQIVDFANRFMERFKMDGLKPVSYNYGDGACTEVDIGTIYIGKYNNQNVCSKFMSNKEPYKIEKAQYLKYCTDIIVDAKNKKKKIMILNRSNRVLGRTLEEFEQILQKVCTCFINKEDFKERVVVKTVHKSKGEEADIVILLNINEGSFPVYNPNNELFELFGESRIDSMEDEQRLYYVGITRAKEELHILYQNKKKSTFIMKQN